MSAGDGPEAVFGRYTSIASVVVSTLAYVTAFDSRTASSDGTG